LQLIYERRITADDFEPDLDDELDLNEDGCTAVASRLSSNDNLLSSAD